MVVHSPKIGLSEDVKGLRDCLGQAACRKVHYRHGGFCMVNMVRPACACDHKPGLRQLDRPSIENRPVMPS